MLQRKAGVVKAKRNVNSRSSLISSLLFAMAKPKHILIFAGFISFFGFSLPYVSAQSSQVSPLGINLNGVS
jgi:hypothetical protein